MRDRLRQPDEERCRASAEAQIISLYDELLQNVQGLVLSFDAAASRLPDGVARKMFDTTLERADRVLRDARISLQAVDALRGGIG